ncbi:hypothetical protein HanIR_Chr08g0378591 [Helianthus annuus]|nr:hypothetical protein HanIR_Chr08g0378591 [Helianthus annuus]
MRPSTASYEYLLTWCMKMGVHIAMRPRTASCERFHQCKGSGQQQQSPQAAMRPGTASHKLSRSENAETTVVTAGSDAARHRILPTRQVGLTPQSKWHHWQSPVSPYVSNRLTPQ